jgi:hypothetical protein
LLAVVAPSKEILIWDLARGRELRRFKGYDPRLTALAFSPDSRQLVSGLDDSTLLVWDLGSQNAMVSTRLSVEAIEKAWADLAGTDAARAYRARWALAASPDEALALLQNHLRPVRETDGQQLRALLANLGSDQFAVRERSQAELVSLGDVAEPALRQALADNLTLELRQRVQKVLGRLRGPVTRPEVMRSLRAAAVLEDIGTPAARKLLETLTSGAPAARLTREAQASLSRLNRRAPAVP